MAQRETGEDELGPYQVKSPGAVTDVEADWGPWLEETGVASIDHSVWASDGPLTLTSTGIDGAFTHVQVAGGNRGFDHILSNTINAGGRTEVWEIRIKVR